MRVQACAEPVFVPAALVWLVTHLLPASPGLVPLPGVTSGLSPAVGPGLGGCGHSPTRGSRRDHPTAGPRVTPRAAAALPAPADTAARLPSADVQLIKPTLREKRAPGASETDVPAARPEGM